jgi:hypothetical protein
MKKIIIYKNPDPLVLTDDDETNITEYTKQLSLMLESSKICILETTSGNVILRPSKIDLIFVSEEETDGIKKKTVFNKTDVIKD